MRFFRVARFISFYGIATLIPADTLNAETDGIGNWLRPLDTLNQQLPSWLRFQGVYRNRAEHAGHLQFGPQSDSYVLSRLRLRMTVQPKSWLRFVAETQDARLYGNDRVASTPPNQNGWDLHQAYVQLGDPKSGKVLLRAGRQALRFGDEWLVGSSEYTNTARTFDAVRVDLQNARYALSLFSSSVVLAREGVFDHHLQGNNLHGAYSRFKSVLPGGVIEPYVFWRLAPGGVGLNETAGRGAMNAVTLGVRVDGKLPARFDYNIEMDRQTGSLGLRSIHAWAGHWNVGKRVGDAGWKPRLFLEANYASGTRDPASRDWGGFDSLYPSAHDKLGFADRVGWKNIRHFRTGVETRPWTKWKLKQTYEDFWLANRRDALYTPVGSPIAAIPDGSGGSHVGREMDFVAEVAATSSVELGFGYARFFTGEFLNRANKGRDYNYPYVYLTYRLNRKMEP